jgi:rhodanese-related sulfurtransferase
MKNILLIFSIIPAFLFPVFRAKAQVKSKSFAIVLKRLLLHKVPEVSVDNAAALYNSYIFLDARENDEYAVSHLPGAMYVGYKKFKPVVLKNIPKDKPIVVYCSVGKRSENIAEKLINDGYKNVSNLYGGIFEWVNQGHEVYNGSNKKTPNVHAYNFLWGQFLYKGKKVY